MPEACSPRAVGRVFVPHDTCTVASGDCFVEGRCLARCRTRLSAAEANEKLTQALHLLREMRGYVLMFRDTTGYVDGSSIDAAVKSAGVLLKQMKW